MKYSNFFYTLFGIIILAVSFMACSQEDELIPADEQGVLLENIEVESREDCEHCDCDIIINNFEVFAIVCVLGATEEEREEACEQLSLLEPAYIRCNNLEEGCPEGWKFTDCHCTAGLAVPQGYDAFIYEHKDGSQHFYVHPNCNLGATNNCCPPGWQFTGSHCNYPNSYIPQGFNPGFTYEHGDGTTHFYVDPQCVE